MPPFIFENAEALCVSGWLKLSFHISDTNTQKVALRNLKMSHLKYQPVATRDGILSPMCGEVGKAAKKHFS